MPQENRAPPRKKQNRVDTADRRRRNCACHHELVVALNAAPDAPGGAKRHRVRRAMALARRHHMRLEMAAYILAVLVGKNLGHACREQKSTRCHELEPSLHNLLLCVK